MESFHLRVWVLSLVIAWIRLFEAMHQCVLLFMKIGCFLKVKPWSNRFKDCTVCFLMSWEMVSVGALNLDTFFFQAMAWLVFVQLDF